MNEEDDWMRGIQAIALLLAVGVQLTACTDQADPADTDGAPSSTAPAEPDSGTAPTATTASYRYRLKSYCGHRALLGNYTVVERDGAIEKVEVLPPRWSMFVPEPSDIPTLADLLAKAEDARSRADVSLEVDESGLPVVLEIDHYPRAIDDEECYEVSNLLPLPH